MNNKPFYSLGCGDRFGREGEAQLAAYVESARRGVLVCPVWNKSHREHTTVLTEPASVRAEADTAVAALGWDQPWFVDADHINLANVDDFIEWLAIAAVIEHWDAYGSMTHNYYLYNDPDTGQITWISWDHNETLSTGMGGGNRTVSLDKSEVGDNWPLIRFLLDDPVYYELYVNDLAETVAGPFNPDQMAETYQSMADLIAPYAAADVGEEAFNSAVQQLIDHTYQRAEDVNEFLSNLEK